MEQKFVLLGIILFNSLLTVIRALSLHQMTQDLEGSNICAGITFDLLPYKSNCAYFIICQNEYARVEECPFEQVFDRRLHGCVPKSRAICHESKTKFIDPPSRCPEVDDPNNPTFLPDIESCSTYYVCSNGTKITRNCAEGLVFDPQHSWCDIPENVPSCRIASTTLPTTTSRTDYNCNSWLRCPINGIANLPHMQRCERYFECQLGVRFVRTCEDGMIFDINTMQCNDSAQATCAKYVC